MNILEKILPSTLFEITEKAGICNVKQIITLSVYDIKKLTNLRNEDILMLKNIVTQSICPITVTGNELQIQKELIKTGCTAIDNLLCGGIRRGTLTEIYGESGAGKTQIVLQIAANSDGSAFICTEDSFPIKRFNQMKQNKCDIKDFQCQPALFIEHLTEAHELLSCIRVRLPKLLSKNNVSVVIIDSVAGPFRCEYTNYVQRSEDLKELGILLYNLAQQFNIAVICINQVTSSFDESVNVVPSLGLVWSNLTSIKLKIAKLSHTVFMEDYNQDVTVRTLTVVQAPYIPVSVAKFIITRNGIEIIS